MDGRMLGKEECENMKQVVSKFGISVVCDEEDAKPKPDIIMPAGDGCENMKQAVSKLGMTVVCEE